jgi:hypothetical protein
VNTSESRRLERVFADIRTALSDESVPAVFRALGGSLLARLTDPGLASAEIEMRALALLEIMKGPFPTHGEDDLADLRGLFPSGGALPVPDDTPWAPPPKRRFGKR